MHHIQNSDRTQLTGLVVPGCHTGVISEHCKDQDQDVDEAMYVIFGVSLC